jgi:hypothetical protein
MLPSHDGSFFAWRGKVETFSRHTETFIVRLWVEYLEQAPPSWRGEIEHVDGEVIRFGTLREMNDFMHRCATMRQPARDGSKMGEQADEVDSGNPAGGPVMRAMPGGDQADVPARSD